MNLINKLTLIILFVHLPAYEFYLKHSNCSFSPNWKVNITNLRVTNNENSTSDSSIIEPMLESKGNITLVALLDSS